MSENELHSTIWKRAIIIYLFCLAVFALIVMRLYSIQHTERAQWMRLSDSLRKENVVKDILPDRGNIYADDDQLLVASVPVYKLAIDFKTPALREDGGKLFKENVDSLATCLADYLKDQSAAQYRSQLWKGYRTKSGYCLISRLTLNHDQYKMIQTFPLFRLGSNKSGLVKDRKIKRIKSFGILASVTLGRYSVDEAKAYNGIEHAYDSILRGRAGKGHIEQMAGASILTSEIPAVNGSVILTTLNVSMQDICEKALMKKMLEVRADEGAVILMETRSGQIKAIANLVRTDSSGTSYYESKNIALRSDMEPGSTFKVPALMAALEDGTVEADDSVDCGNGVWQVNPKITIKDHNTGEKANHVIPIGQAIVRSSNIGMGKTILEQYDNKKKAIHYIDVLKKMGVGQRIDLGFKGMAHARIEGPEERADWTYTDVASIAYGYSVNMPLLYTLTFYNAIANDGVMMQPYLIKSITRDGIEEQVFGPKIMKNPICSKKTLNAIREMMLGVVEDEHGTASKSVRSKYVRIAGKTGTARYDYRNNKTPHHQISFCGFFPYEEPRYSCIVFIKNPKAPAAAGPMAGGVFREIAEHLMASETYIPIGQYREIETANQRKENDTTYREVEYRRFGNLEGITKEGKKRFLQAATRTGANQTPDCRNLGLKDAIYLAESRTLRPKVNGRGKVYKQTPEAGTPLQKNTTIHLYLK
ncbi:MAG: transpeptidase family protein [Paludibacteraceae bacterium]|nr:transpeptidase family protein [Paludibacteraceae bacterium]